MRWGFLISHRALVQVNREKVRSYSQLDGNDRDGEQSPHGQGFVLKARVRLRGDPKRVEPGLSGENGRRGPWSYEAPIDAG